MGIAATVGIVLGVAALTAVVTAARRGRPGPKRTHLFERDDGERANPFADLSAGAEAAGERDRSCRDCGVALDADSYQYCVSCASRVVADD